MNILWTGSDTSIGVHDANLCVFVDLPVYGAGIEPRALYILGKHSTAELHPQLIMLILNETVNKKAYYGDIEARWCNYHLHR